MSDLVWAIDVSNHQPANLTGLIQQHNPEHVVVRLSVESAEMALHARAQIMSALWLGRSVSGYIWAYWDMDPESYVKAAVKGVEPLLRRVWFDCEDGSPDNLDDWLSRAVAQVEAMGLQAGVYTSTNWWREHGDSQGFTRLPLWLATLDEEPTLDIDPARIPGGWAKLGGRQWSDTGGTLDRDVFDPAVVAAVTPVSPQPCLALRQALLNGPFPIRKRRLQDLLKRY